jgi:HNH endonuclease
MKQININELKIAVLNAKNISQTMRNLKRAESSAGRKIIIKYINKYNIDISHFETTRERYERVLKPYNEKKTKISNTAIFIVNSTYLSGNKIKKRLYDAGLKECKCELCGQDENWHGQHMSLILDHINGIHNDNRIENLRILCPNCNATLPTHCRGSKGLKNINKIKTKNIKIRNIKKISESQRKVKRPPYEQLQNEVNELGYSATGRKYGVSDNAIRKWIKFYKNYNMLGSV